eukprot:7823874-Pyramimonas_sp.AAC.1
MDRARGEDNCRLPGPTSAAISRRLSSRIAGARDARVGSGRDCPPARAGRLSAVSGPSTRRMVV